MCMRARCALLLTALLLAAQHVHVRGQPLTTAAAKPGKGICRGYLIHILDLNVFAESQQYPKCTPEVETVVNAASGIVYLPEDDHAPGYPDRPFDWSVHHKFGTHSAPWYLAQAIKASDCYTEDIEQAQAVYVYDYCYYIWWVATLHSRGAASMTNSPGDYLIRGWRAVMELPRWKRTQGRDFVFYDPHPGFASGDAAPIFRSMQCNELRKSTQLIVDYGMRTHCDAYWEMRKLVITPNVPNIINISSPLDTFSRPFVPLAQRNTLMYFSGRCTPWDDGNLGKLFRYRVFNALNTSVGGDPTVNVRCSEKELGGLDQGASFPLMLDSMEHSEFCLVLAGDSQSTRRLSEIFLAGCIPVFIGPPYNSLPFPVDIDYRHAAIFFNITNTKEWLPEPVTWSRIGPLGHARHPNDAVWWLPDIDVSDVAIQVDSIAPIVGHLRHMPKSEKERRLNMMAEYRLRMTFQEQATFPVPNAVNSLLSAITRVMRRLHRVRQNVARSVNATAQA